MGLHSKQVHFKASDSALQWHESSPGARRGFCKVCGTSLFFESKKWPDETHIALGCIDEPHSFKPSAHANYDTRVSWMAVDEGLKIYP